MKKIALITSLVFLATACSIKEPRVAFGKKCEVNDNKITYSYVWIYDKTNGLPATTEQCAALEKEANKK